MRKIITKTGVQVVLIGVLSLVGASFFLQRKCVPQFIPGGGQTRLILPNYWTQIFGSAILLERQSGGRAKLFYGWFESPLLLLPGQKVSTVICVYQFDIENDVIVFDLGARRGRYAPARGDEDLRWLVLRSEFPFRRASPDELRYALKAVGEMSEGDYRRASVPAWDLGWFRRYVPRQDIATLVKEKLQEKGRLQ